MPQKPAKPKTGQTTEEALEFDLSKAQRLNNAYAEYLHPNNTKIERTLSLEHGIARSTLKGRIKGRKAKAVEDENRQRLIYLEEDALKDQCL